MEYQRRKLIQGSVIYMKKMRNSKRGFSLTELIIVVAIIVIVASAAFVGVAVVLENAKNSSDEVNRRHGRDESGKELFEAEAWVEIDELTKDAANFFDVSLYKPVHTSTPTVTPTPTDTPANGGGGGGSTTTPTQAPKVTATNPPTATPEPTKTQSSGGNTTSVSKATKTNSWDGNAQYDLTFTYNGTTTVSSITFDIPLTGNVTKIDGNVTAVIEGKVAHITFTNYGNPIEPGTTFENIYTHMEGSGKFGFKL